MARGPRERTRGSCRIASRGRGDRGRRLQAVIDDDLAEPIAAPEPPARGRPEMSLDPATLRAACDDDATLLRKLIQVFQADIPGSLARVCEAVQERDAQRLREAAHRLRGLLSSFSATAAAEAARLETMGAGGRLDDAASTLDGLAEMVGRLGPLLDDLSIEQLRRQADGPGPP